MSDFEAGCTVELLHEGKPTGILGTVKTYVPPADYASVEFPFSIKSMGTAVNIDHLRRVEPQFIAREEAFDEALFGFHRRYEEDDIAAVERVFDAGVSWAQEQASHGKPFYGATEITPAVVAQQERENRLISKRVEQTTCKHNYASGYPLRCSSCSVLLKPLYEDFDD
jgi:hypothetical protein